MVIQILSIKETATADISSSNVGWYRVVLEADGKPEEFLYCISLSGPEPSVTWKPTSFLSDPAVPVLAVAFISDTVIRFHQEIAVTLPTLVEPIPLGLDTLLLTLEGDIK